MERFVTLAIPGMVALLMVRFLLLPIRLGWKLLANSGGGLLCLWLLNAVAPFTGVWIPVNAVTVAVAGFLGLPGMGLLAILAAI